MMMMGLLLPVYVFNVQKALQADVPGGAFSAVPPLLSSE